MYEKRRTPTMGSDPTFRVTAYPRWWRLVAAVAFVASRTSLPTLVFAVLGSRFAVEAVTVVRWFVTFVALPALLAAAIARALEATLRIGERDLTIVRSGLQVDVPLVSIDRVSVWQLPFPSAGLTVRLASGRSLPQTIGATDPLPVLQALSHHGVAGESAADHPLTVYAHARAEQGPWRWTHLLARFPLFALLPTAPLFNVHQHIAYGGLFGQYYLLGLRPYLETFALYWGTVTVYLVLYASLWRGPAELVCLVAAAVAPSTASRVRRGAEWFVRIVYYGGVPVLLAWRFAPW